MINTPFSKYALAVARDTRSMLKDGWELVGEGGGPLWELHRGRRMENYEIVDVRIAATGKELWVKIAEKQA